jgi:hypothetical protein
VGGGLQLNEMKSYVKPLAAMITQLEKILQTNPTPEKRQSMAAIHKKLMTMVW